MLTTMSYFVCTLLLTVMGYEVEGLYSMAKLSVGRAEANPCPMTCDLRSCPVVNVDTCSGRMERDHCQCCPVCNMTQVYTNQNESSQLDQLEADDPEACKMLDCDRQEMCLLNIQGIAVCRCPSSIYCRNRPRKPVCSEEGTTYRSICYLKMTACVEDRRIALKHKGPCEGSKEAERATRLQKKREKQEKREQRLEKRKLKEEKKDKKTRKEEKQEARKQKQEAKKKQRGRTEEDEDKLAGNRGNNGHRGNGKKNRKEELRVERRQHRRKIRKIMKEQQQQ